MKKKKNIAIESLRQNKSFQDFVFILLSAIVVVIIIYAFDPIKGFGEVFSGRFEDISKFQQSLGIITLGLLIFALRREFELRKEKIRSKEFERRMLKSRAELQAVLDGVPDMILQVDKNMRILWGNRAALKKDPSAIGKTAAESFSEFGESVIETYAKWATITGVIERGIKYQPTGVSEAEEIYWEGIGIPIKGKGGEIYGAIAIARDVTERMRLEHTSNLLASIVESTEDAIYGMTYDASVLSWNLGAEQIYGYDSKDMTKQNALATVPVENRKSFLKKIEAVIRTQNIERFETTRLKKNGEEIFVSVTLCPFVDATGKKIGVSAIDRDITLQKKAEKALIESEERYRELFENMSSGVFVFEAIKGGSDFILKDFNRGGEKIENASKHRLQGKKCSEALKEFKTEELLDSIKKVYKTGEPTNKLVTIKENGKITGWRSNHVYKLPSGEIVDIFDDITERVKAEDELRKSEEKFRTLVRTAPDGIALTDAKGKIQEANRAFANILGYSREQTIDKYFFDLFEEKTSKKKAEEVLSDLIEKGKIRQREISSKTKDGKSLYLDVSLAPLRDEKGLLSGVIIITRDISLRIKYELELEDSKDKFRKLALHLQTAREQERKNIAHEIHDELGYALTALKLDLTWLSKKTNIKEYKLTNKTKEMSELIDTMINKVRSISTELRPSILDHFGLIAAIEWQANEFQKRTAIRCKLDIEQIDMNFDDFYATAMFRIFQETLTNVARHAKASRVDVVFKKDNGSVILSISDNGIGMPMESLNDHKSLGLVGIRERAYSIGGEVNFLSGNGSGTTVVLTVPVKQIGVKQND